MSRLVTLVVTGISAVALSTVAAPIWAVQEGLFDFKTAGSTTAVSKTGNWCC